MGFKLSNDVETFAEDGSAKMILMMMIIIIIMQITIIIILITVKIITIMHF